MGQLQIRIPDDLKERFNRVCERQHVNKSALIRGWVEEYLKNEEGEKMKNNSDQKHPYKITCKCGNKYMMLRGMREYPFDGEPIYWCCICGRIKSGDEWNEPLVLEETEENQSSDGEKANPGAS